MSTFIKNGLVFFILLFLAGKDVLAQSVPAGINYQAIARNSAGSVFVNSSVGVKISILSGSSTGAVLYSESHQATTNQFGLFSFKIGGGTVISGDFATIPWNNANQWVKVEVDPTGGSNYTPIGTTELLSVPYALYAQSAGNGGQGGTTGPQGPQGIQGEIGPVGPQGPGGTAGSQGEIGIAGPQGLQGLQGLTGAAGPVGPVGQIGIAGPQGLQGLIGPAGPAGSGSGNSIVSAVKIGYGDAVTTPSTFVSLGGAGTANAASLWIENATSQCAVCTQVYAQSLPNFAGQAVLLDIPIQQITIANDGVPNKGVLVMANVTVKSTNNATSLGNSNRYSIWLQRSTNANFNANVTNIYRVEDGLSGGVNNIPAVVTLGSGIACTSITYPDLNLSAGTYYYRLVYQNILGSNNGQTVFAQDRSMILMQISQ